MDTIECIHDAARYLDAARRALAVVQHRMDIGASNQIPQSFQGWHARTLCVAESRRKIEIELKQIGATAQRTGVQGDPMKTIVDTWASWAAFYGCGNCGEQSAVAFVHLRDVLGVLPLDWMEYGGFSHAFVVIGRIRETDPTRVETWNDDAVICDPWADIVLAARKDARLKGKALGLLYRLDGESAAVAGVRT